MKSVRLHTVGHQKVRRGEFKILAMLLCLILITVSIMTISFRATAGDKGDKTNIQKPISVQEELKGLLGCAKSYGVFTNEFHQMNDFQSNFAAKKYYLYGQSIGSDLSTSMGTIYFQEMVRTGSNMMMQLKPNAADHIVIGMPFENDESQHRINIQDSDLYIAYANSTKTKFHYDEKHDFLNIEAGLNYVRNNANTYAEKEDSKGIQWDKTDNNKVILDITKCTDPICVVSISGEDYHAYELGKLDIIKNDDQMIMINVKVNNQTKEFSLTRYRINDVSSATGDYQDKKEIGRFIDFLNNADTIMWNFNDYDGLINISETSGIILAPKAEVKLLSTCSGRVICNKFSNPSGELHFLSQDVPSETETDSSSVKETTTPEQTTPEQTTPEQTTPEQTTPEQTTPEQTTPEQTTPEQTTPEQTTPEQTTPEQTTPEQTTPEQTTPEQTTPEQTTPEQTTPEQTTPEQTTPEQTTPEQTTPQQTTSAVIETTTSGEESTPAIRETTTQDPSLPTTPQVQESTTDETIPVIVSGGGPKTGDGIYLAIYIIIMVTAVLLFTGVGIYKLHQKGRNKQ